MKKSVLQEIAEKLLDSYGSDRHFEIIKAEKMGHYEDEVDGWRLEICEIVEPVEPIEPQKNKGAKK
jgi:hypothetical protein